MQPMLDLFLHLEQKSFKFFYGSSIFLICLVAIFILFYMICLMYYYCIFLIIGFTRK